jgi:hypothetical protein
MESVVGHRWAANVPTDTRDPTVVVLTSWKHPLFRYYARILSNLMSSPQDREFTRPPCQRIPKTKRLGRNIWRGRSVKANSNINLALCTKAMGRVLFLRPSVYEVPRLYCHER